MEEEYLNQVLSEELAVEEEDVPLQDGSNNGDAAPKEEPTACADALPPTFSKFADPCGFNGKVLSWSRINSVLGTEFGNRKHIQDSKLRIFNYWFGNYYLSVDRCFVGIWLY